MTMASPETLGHKSYAAMVGRDVGALAEIGQDFHVRWKMIQLTGGLSLGNDGQSQENRNDRDFMPELHLSCALDYKIRRVGKIRCEAGIDRLGLVLFDFEVVLKRI